jgi:hypothetical protein
VYPHIDHIGRCHHCKESNVTYNRIRWEAMEKAVYFSDFAPRLSDQTRADDNKLEQEVLSAISREFSVNEATCGRQVTLEHLIYLANQVADAAVCSYLVRRTPLLVLYARPAVAKVFSAHFLPNTPEEQAMEDEGFVDVGEDGCGFCDGRDIVEPPRLRQRAEQYAVRFLDSECGDDSAESRHIVARKAAEAFIHDFLADDLRNQMSPDMNY